MSASPCYVAPGVRTVLFVNLWLPEYQSDTVPLGRAVAPCFPPHTNFIHTFLKYWGLKSPPVLPSPVCTLHIPCNFICSLGFILQPSLITSLSTLSAHVFLLLQTPLPTQLPSGPPPAASSLGLRQSSLPTRVPPNLLPLLHPCRKDRPRPATTLGSHSQFSHCLILPTCLLLNLFPSHPCYR